MRIDLHVHTKYSVDGFSPPERLVRAAKRRGLDGIAVTDHNHTKAFPELKAIAKKERDFLLVLGEEVKVVERGRKIGEVLVYFINEPIEPGAVGEVFDQVHEQDAFTSVPHPYGHYGWDAPHWEKYIRRADAVEILNSKALFASLNARSKRLAEHLRKPITAGLDAHLALEVGDAFIETDAASQEELRKNLEKKRVKAIGRRTFPLPMLLACALKKRTGKLNRLF